MGIAGEAFENPVTNEKMVFDKTGRDTNGSLLAIEFFIQPSMGKGLAAHFHPYFDERFEILVGSAHYKLGNEERSTEAGDVFVLSRGIPHVHPWNVGNDVLHYRKTIELDKPDLQWLLETEEFFESLYALAQQGKIGNDGLPKNLLQKVVVVQAIQPHTYAAGIPIWIQNNKEQDREPTMDAIIGKYRVRMEETGAQYAALSQTNMRGISHLMDNT